VDRLALQSTILVATHMTSLYTDLLVRVHWLRGKCYLTSEM
jgi:hypothetical protein